MTSKGLVSKLHTAVADSKRQGNPGTVDEDFSQQFSSILAKHAYNQNS
jgi:hypothetical protein